MAEYGKNQHSYNATNGGSKSVGRRQRIAKDNLLRKARLIISHIKKGGQKVLERNIKVTVYISDITKLEIALNEARRIAKNHPYAVINIEVGNKV